MTGVQELLRHLRANPGEGDVGALALRFGLDRKLVEMAVRSLPKEAPVKHDRKSPVIDSLRSVTRLWNKALLSTVWFLVVTSVIAWAMIAFSSTAPGVVQVGTNLHIKTSGILGLLALLVTPLLQFLSLAKCDRYRYALLGGLVFAGAMGIGLHSGLAAVGIGVMYLVASGPVVVGGAYIRMRREGKKSENMSRQEMLQRLLEVRTALEDHAPGTAQNPTKKQDIKAFLEANIVWIALTLTLIESAVSSTLLMRVDPGRTVIRAQADSQTLPPGLTPGLLVLITFVSVASNVGHFVFGFLAPRFRTTLAVILAQSLVTTSYLWVPGAYTSAAFYTEFGWGKFVLGTFMIAVIITIGTFSRQIYDYAALKARRTANDPEALMAEMIDLEWRLTPKSSRVTVLAVDVAGSTAMKQNADPMVTEWSFREYQKMIETTCAKYGGKAESTAGDGAIVGFVEPAQAVDAAIAIQSDIGAFNNNVNRMSVPFRLRIGLHMGEVQGELGDVQFTRVIDVAAHIESKAPIGGIAVSETMTEALGNRNFQKAAVTTDGHDVFFLTDPLAPSIAEKD